MIARYTYTGRHRRGGAVHFVARLVAGVLFYTNLVPA